MGFTGHSFGQTPNQANERLTPARYSPPQLEARSHRLGCSLIGCVGVQAEELGQRGCRLLDAEDLLVLARQCCAGRAGTVTPQKGFPAGIALKQLVAFSVAVQSQLRHCRSYVGPAWRQQVGPTNR